MSVKYIYVLEVAKETITATTAHPTLKAAQDFADYYGDFEWKNDGDDAWYYEKPNGDEYVITKIPFYE